MVKEQLVNIFGPEMGNALSLEIKDWAQDIRVSIPLDANGPGYHPAHGLRAAIRNLWDGKLIFRVNGAGASIRRVPRRRILKRQIRFFPL